MEVKEDVDVMLLSSLHPKIFPLDRSQPRRNWFSRSTHGSRELGVRNLMCSGQQSVSGDKILIDQSNLKPTVHASKFFINSLKKIENPNILVWVKLLHNAFPNYTVN